MKICLIAEGCYPYVVGGVSSWIHRLIQAFPNQEYIILTIVANRSYSGKYVYELPGNVTELHELYLEDYDWGRKRKRIKLLKNKEYKALRSLLLNQQVDWETLFDLFQKRSLSVNNLLMSVDFFNAVSDCYNLNYSQIVFSDFLWMMRSIYLPMFHTLKMEIPEADLYHCTATGYAGILGSMAKYIYGGRLLISEHGIYTREREEELIKAKWVQGIYKDIWIEQFRKMSNLAYDRADLVTSLYEHARELEVELGCPFEKTIITPNGISVENFQNLPGKTEEEKGRVYVGAVLRVAPIKDIKTLIHAFSFAREEEPSLKLWIMGPWEEEKEYAQECFELVESEGITDVEFTGRVDIREYLGKMDMTILTSISEGQPLTILESFAAHKPVIATDVGNCRGLIMGEDDEFGAAGIVTHIMNVEEIARAMVSLARNEAMRLWMGENGYRRVLAKYQYIYMIKAYRSIYKDFAGSMGLDWIEDEAEKETWEGMEIREEEQARKGAEIREEEQVQKEMETREERQDQESESGVNRSFCGDLAGSMGLLWRGEEIKEEEQVQEEEPQEEKEKEAESREEGELQEEKEKEAESREEEELQEEKEKEEEKVQKEEFGKKGLEKKSGKEKSEKKKSKKKKTKEKSEEKSKKKESGKKSKKNEFEKKSGKKKTEKKESEKKKAEKKKTGKKLKKEKSKKKKSEKEKKLRKKDKSWQG